VAQLQAWREDLEVSPESLLARPVCVVEEDGQLIGFALGSQCQQLL
jgi:hypothetical protein